MTEATTIQVGGPAAYDVVIGHDLTSTVPGLLRDGVQQVLVVHPAAVRDVAARVIDALRGHQVTPVEVPDGEAAKTYAVAEMLWDRLGAAGFTRSDAVVAVGGGATTDLAGFVAATWLRGVAVVHVPTTLLGMVDAAVGGKTAIDTAHGKNLVGAFHPPAGVLCDLRTLQSLPRAELASGMAEVVKAGFLADPVILDLIEADPAAALDPAAPVLRDLIERAIRHKARVVTADLTDAGEREHLNYGHTLGHAIERVEDFARRHGEAVSVGMVFAAELSAAAGRLERPVVDRHRSVLASLGLPTTYPADAWPDLLAAMRLDKKARGATLRFVVLEGLGRPAVLDGPDPALLEAAYERVAT